ncbi:hypothetical protein V498_07670 [Pseudogymnoascus sp. VKM F-4517 (FW-2822)]|nr:hypothetical protein V498_07670 [Pseudogymnoascus sp. VKM F-4517 (FW-2822)]
MVAPIGMKPMGANGTEKVPIPVAYDVEFRGGQARCACAAAPFAAIRCVIAIVGVHVGQFKVIDPITFFEDPFVVTRPAAE